MYPSRLRITAAAIAALLALCIWQPLAARDPVPFEEEIKGGSWFRYDFKAGIEWGYCQYFYKFRHYNIQSIDGYRINEKSQGMYMYPDGQILASVGANISRHLHLSLLGGYAGISDSCRVYPLLMRLSWFPHTVAAGGIFFDADCGVGFNSGTGSIDRRKAAGIADIGGGYRVRLTPRLSLDFLAAFRLAIDSPSIPDPDVPGMVSADRIRRNNAAYYAVDFSVALSF